MITERCDRLLSLLKTHNLDSVLITDEINLRFLSYDCIFSGKLWFSSEKIILFVSKMDYSLYCHLKNIQVIPVDSFTFGDAFHKFFTNYLHETGIDSHLIDYQSTVELMKIIPGLVCIPHLLASLRIIKDADELGLLREAADLGTQGYYHLLSLLTPGISEKELVISLKTFWARAGADEAAFSPIVAFGENSAHPHWNPSDRKLKSGDLVLIDIGVMWQGYCSDMTRVVACERSSELWNSYYCLVKEAQAAGLSLCWPGKTNREVDASTRSVFEQKQLSEYFVHGTGHGLGRQVHEHPYISSKAQETVLSEGMVITVEPGIYFINQGGIRLEDSVVITEFGYFNLTNLELLDIIPII